MTTVARVIAMNQLLDLNFIIGITIIEAHRGSPVDGTVPDRQTDHVGASPTARRPLVAEFRTTQSG
jgi:hypothetical protein